jgi:hypothetical protein
LKLSNQFGDVISPSIECVLAFGKEIMPLVDRCDGMNRTRSIVRLSPATSLRSSEIRICNINGDVCVNEKVT